MPDVLSELLLLAQLITVPPTPIKLINQQFLLVSFFLIEYF